MAARQKSAASHADAFFLTRYRGIDDVRIVCEFHYQLAEQFAWNRDEEVQSCSSKCGINLVSESQVLVVHDVTDPSSGEVHRQFAGRLPSAACQPPRGQPSDSRPSRKPGG